MKTIVSISAICLASFLLAQGNENNFNNGVENNKVAPKVEEKRKLKSNLDEDQNLNLNQSAVFDSKIQTGRYNYEFTRKKFKRQNKTKGFTSEQQNQLDGFITTLEENSQESFEYNYLKYVNGNHNTDLFPFLERAYKLKPYDASLFDDFISYYEITNNPAKKAEFTKKLMAAKVIETGVYKYNENVLRSVDKNGILITNGYDDTYPIWVLQNEKGVRKDVRVLSLDLLQNKTYRKRILKSYGLKDPGVGPDSKDFILKLCSQNASKNIFLGFTVPKFVLKSLSIQLKNTGLALKYAPNKLNEDKLKINFEKSLQFDYLLGNQSSRKVKSLNANYLVTLVQLHTKYKHDLKKQDYIKRIALKVAKDINKEKQIRQSLGL
jgi:hypothetical protein